MIPHLDIAIVAVLEVHNDSLELNGATLDSKLDRTEHAASVHTNVIMIPPAIYA